LQVASEVRIERVEWFWRSRIAVRSLTLLLSRQGIGKSTFTAQLAARASRGELDGELAGQPCATLFCTAEDSITATAVPRLCGAGADLDRIAFLHVESDGVEGVLTLPDDAEELGKRAIEAGAALLVLDPLVAFLPSKIDSHRDQHVRRALAPLAQLAAERELAILAVLHPNKGTSSDALTRASGSIGFTAAARSVLVLGVDPNDPDGEAGRGRILAHAKSNLAPLAPSLACRIEPCQVESEAGATVATSRLLIGDESGVSAADLLVAADPDESSAQGEAEEFLRAELGEGPVAYNALMERARDAGHSEKTLRRVKARLRIKSERTGQLGGGGEWHWALPEGRK
jgi:hypothetical protein